MTEGSLIHHDKSMCIRLWLEVGHVCEPRQSTDGKQNALDWTVWVRGVGGSDISAFVHKVIFHLHPATSFVYPKRVRHEPPYEIQESGRASIDIPIDVYLKHSNKPKIINLRYSLQIENNNKSSSDSRCLYYDVANPSEQLCKALMSGGGEVVPRAGVLGANNNILVVLSDSADDKPHKLKNNKKYKFVEPIQCIYGTKKRAKSNLSDEICSKCGNSVYADLRKLMRSVAMHEDDINCVSQFYFACKSYDKSAGAIVLPPLSDDIYRVPELPPGLKKALEEVEDNHNML